MTSKQYIRHLTAADGGIRGKDVPQNVCASVIDGLCGVIAGKDAVIARKATVIASKDADIARLNQLHGVQPPCSAFEHYSQGSARGGKGSCRPGVSDTPIKRHTSKIPGTQQSRSRDFSYCACAIFQPVRLPAHDFLPKVEWGKSGSGG